MLELILYLYSSLSIQVPPFLYLREKLVHTAREHERYRNYLYKRQASQYTGNGRFEGYIMELLVRIGDHVRGIDFEFEVELVPDNQYGTKGDFDDVWSGMIGEVVRGVS